MHFNFVKYVAIWVRNINVIREGVMNKMLRIMTGLKLHQVVQNPKIKSYGFRIIFKKKIATLEICLGINQI